MVSPRQKINKKPRGFGKKYQKPRGFDFFFC